MRKFVALNLVILCLLVASSLAVAQVEDFSKGRVFGIGLQFTAPTDPSSPSGIFPASGLSSRIWIIDLLGVEVDLFVVAGSPSFTMRALFKAFNLEIVDIYIGGGVAFYSFGGKLYTPFQGTGGLEISLSRNLALNAEVGFFGLGGVGGGVTAGLGAHFYF